MMITWIIFNFLRQGAANIMTAIIGQPYIDQDYTWVEIIY